MWTRAPLGPFNKTRGILLSSAPVGCLGAGTTRAGGWVLVARLGLGLRFGSGFLRSPSPRCALALGAGGGTWLLTVPGWRGRGGTYPDRRTASGGTPTRRICALRRRVGRVGWVLVGTWYQRPPAGLKAGPLAVLSSVSHGSRPSRLRGGLTASLDLVCSTEDGPREPGKERST